MVLHSLEFFAENDMDRLSSFNLVMSEFGIPCDKETSLKLEFMEKHVSEIYQLGIPMIVWDDGGDYALMDNQRAAWDKARQSDQVAEASSQWPVVSVRWAVGSCRWPVADGQWSVAGGQWAVGSVNQMRIKENSLLPTPYSLLLTSYFSLLTTQSHFRSDNRGYASAHG